MSTDPFEFDKFDCSETASDRHSLSPKRLDSFTIRLGDLTPKFITERSFGDTQARTVRLGDPVSKYLTLAEAARFLRLSECTVRRWVKHGIIRASRLPGPNGRWLIPRAELHRFLDEPEVDE